MLAPPAVCLLLNDDALRKRDCSSDAGAQNARRAFLRGATWLFKKAPK